MKLTIENTTKIITLIVNGCEVPARVWQGESESGIPVQCYITRVVPEIPESNPQIDDLTAEFERELKRQAKPRVTIDAIRLRMILP